MPNTHSPLPWHIAMVNSHVPGCKIMQVQSSNGEPICTPLQPIDGPEGADECEINAEFIVRAVNSHAALVSALEAMLVTFGTHTDSLARSTISQARAALALAKGEA